MKRTTLHTGGDRTLTQQDDAQTVSTAMPDDALPSARALGERLPLRESQRYQLGPVHGQGGLGRVLIAYDRDLGRPIAVKELLHRSDRAEARFVREARITARLEHPAIVPVHDAGCRPDGEMFYTMKFVAGRSLKEVIGSCDGLEARLRLLPNVLAVADAIAYAHSKGIIHRDLKPANIILGEYGETVVIDWGLAKDLRGQAQSEDEHFSNDVPVSDTVTIYGEVVGTPAYMSPEQAAGHEVAEPTDVYALGAILYEIVCGSRPYADIASSEPKEIVEAVRRGAPADIAMVVSQPIPVGLVAIITRAMARDPSERYANGAELAADLRRFQDGQLVGAHVYSWHDLARRWIAGHRTLLGAIATGLLAALLVGAFAVARVVEERNEAQRQRSIAAREKVAAETERNRFVLLQANNLVSTAPTSAIELLHEFPSVIDAEPAAAQQVLADAFAEGVATLTISVPALNPNNFFIDVAVHPNDRYIATGHKKIEVWDARARRLVASRAVDSPAVRLGFLGERLLVSVHADGTAESWAFDSNEVTSWKLPSPPRSLVAAAAPHQLFAVGTERGEVVVIDPAKGILSSTRPFKKWVICAAFSPDAQTVICGGLEGMVGVLDLRSGGWRTFSTQFEELM